jgi:hypothetical protein
MIVSTLRITVRSTKQSRFPKQKGVRQMSNRRIAVYVLILFAIGMAIIAHGAVSKSYTPTAPVLAADR